MPRTRRGLLGALSALAATAGCLGGDSTATPTATRTPTATATATETERRTPRETTTPSAATVRLWPTAVTAVLEGEVSFDAIRGAFDDLPSPSRTYRRESTGGTLTYFVAAAPSFYVADAVEAFDAAEDVSVREVYRGVGPNYRRQYASTFAEQAATRGDVDPDAVSVTPGRRGNHQFFDVSAPTGRSALTPILPEMSLRPVGGDGEPIVGPEGFAVDQPLTVRYNRQDSWIVDVHLSLNDDGVESFTAAVEAASGDALREEFFRPVVDGESFRTFGLSEPFVADVENGDWTGSLTLSFPAGTGTDHAIERLTGFPAVPFMFEPSID